MIGGNGNVTIIIMTKIQHNGQTTEYKINNDIYPLNADFFCKHV